MIYGTNQGFVHWRDFDTMQDTKAIMFDNSEKVKYLQLVCIPTLSSDLNTLIAVG